MALTLNLFLFAVAIIGMILSGRWVVKSLISISRILNIREFAVGFIIMGVATSLPELFVGVNAAFDKNPALILGTVIGSNIANLTLVMGIAVLVGRGIKVKQKLVRRDSWMMLATAALPLLLMIDGTLSKFDGAILVVVFMIYMTSLYRQEKGLEKKSKKKKKDKKNGLSFIPALDEAKTLLYSFGFFGGSLGLLFLSANFVVKYATALAFDLSLPNIFIGLFVIAIGTSLPELVFEVQSVLKRHAEAGMGNIIGSVVTNSTLILGVSALIFPLTANLVLFFTSAIFMLLIIFIFITFVQSDKGLSLNEGIALVLLYSFFVMLEFYISTIHA